MLVIKLTEIKDLSEVTSRDSFKIFSFFIDDFYKSYPITVGTKRKKRQIKKCTKED